METEREDVRKKRKAESSVSPVSISGWDSPVVPYGLRSRKTRIVGKSHKESDIENTVDLTREPTFFSEDADHEDMDHAGAGPSKRKKRAPGKPIGGVVGKNAVKGKLDFRIELDCITCDDLRDMGATNVGAIGRECLEVVDAIRVATFRTPGAIECGQR